MGADYAADAGGAKLVSVFLPYGGTVLDVFLQQNVAEAGVAEQYGTVKVYPAGGVYLLNKQVVALTGAPCLAEHFNLAVLDAGDRLDRKESARKCGFRPAPVFRRVASIPLAVVDIAKAQGLDLLRDPEALRRFLNSRDNAAFRTTEERV